MFEPIRDGDELSWEELERLLPAKKKYRREKKGKKEGVKFALEEFQRKVTRSG